MLQRIRDWWLELKITHAQVRVCRLADAGHKYLARAAWSDMVKLIQRRSPAQKARIQRQQRRWENSL